MALPTAPPSIPAPPPYARATTSRFPQRSYTTVQPVLLAPASTYWTCWFHDTHVISSTLLLRDPGVGEYGFELLFSPQRRPEARLRQSGSLDERETDFSVDGTRRQKVCLDGVEIEAAYGACMNGVAQDDGLRDTDAKKSRLIKKI